MLEYEQISQPVLAALRPPRFVYKLAMGLLALGIGALLVTWIYQIKRGMGVAGVSHPVGWGTYIASLVFWIGIAHSGTLISAILLLVRARWRTAISRSAEAMTVIAIMTAAMFPLIHLGRFWVFYFILPYPSQRQIWPNFMSPLLLDLVAILTYMTVSIVFFYVGLLPDLAAARDQLREGENPRWQRRLYYWLSLGWYGRTDQWRHHGRAYLFFAALATPLVISVHSVVSWDFATAILPGWHSTLFAPYFVAGAIHSGLAMVLVLLIPLRKILRFENLIKPKDFNDVALLMIVTTLIIGYSYAVELFIAWYSGDLFETQFTIWRLTGSAWWFYPLIVICNVLLPLLFVFKAVRGNLTLLFIIAIFVNVGMWFERLWIVITSMARDFLPHNWGGYFPRWTELTILSGSFSFFFFGFLVLAKFFPAAPISDIKTEMQDEHGQTERPRKSLVRRSRLRTGVVAVFRRPAELRDAIERLRDHASDGVETYAPLHIAGLEPLLGRRKSPVHFWTLTGALCGLVGGFTLAIGTAQVNELIVGGKHPVSIIPYCVVGFEGTILLGALANFAGMLFHARLPRWKVPPGYDPSFSHDRLGLFVAAPPERFDDVRQALESTGPERTYVVT